METATSQAGTLLSDDSRSRKPYGESTRSIVPALDRELLVDLWEVVRCL